MIRLLILLLIASNVFAADFGIVAMGIQSPKFSCNNFKKDYVSKAKSLHISYLDQSFGTNNKCIKQSIKLAKKLNKKTSLKTYLFNGICQSKGNCQKNEFLNISTSALQKKVKKPKTKKQIIKKLQEIKAFHDSLGLDRSLITPTGLESRNTKETNQLLIQYALEAGWKYEQIVHNPVHHQGYQGYDVGAYYYERHELQFPDLGSDTIGRERGINTLDGTNPRLCANDSTTLGYRLSDTEMREWANKCDKRANTCELWCPESNGLQGSSGTVQAPAIGERPVRYDTGTGSAYLEIVNFSTVPALPDIYNLEALNTCGTMVEWKGNGETVLKQSDYKGTVMVVTPDYHFKKLVAIAPDGKKFKFTKTPTDHNQWNGQKRDHFRILNKDWNTFPSNLVIRGMYKKKGKKFVCWKTKQSGKRYD